ncbi:hypothetical protein [Actinomadura xylanilytica]|uniref:hypothetical protein n=1 Tax=Actinomadura xylanilytica TaxID=887459 RepID=UPI00255B18CF|nr:hypothetical protein [Actinomadura xylanilytica]MDL4777524.1 hypothetical protein [Actinomadura xylanilytica]
MKSIIAGGRAPGRAAAVGVAALGAALLTPGQPAQAAARQATATRVAAVQAAPVQAAPVQAAATQAAKVKLGYSAPKVSGAGDRVTWTWTVRNTGKRGVERVVLVHRLRPRLKIVAVAAPCRTLRASVRCDYGVLRAGRSRRGSLTARIPADAKDGVRISGRLTWWQGARPGAAPQGR